MTDKYFEALYRTMVALLVVFVPLGIWKLVDIVVWLWSHLELRWVLI